MFFKVFIIIFLIKETIVVANGQKEKEIKTGPTAVTELTDKKWDQIQRGQWLIAFFDRDTQKSKDLEDYWQLIAYKCADLNIKVGKVVAPQNPGLYVRFLVTEFPKVFYVKNGVAHEIPKGSKEVIQDLIFKDKKWDDLKPVNFLSNPFSIQMSLLSYLFVHAVNLYNFENAIVQKFISAPSATDVVFGLTFIIVGTFLGLLMTCAFGLIQIFFMDSKESDEMPDDKKHSDDDNEEEDEDEQKDKESSEKSSDVRKRK